MSHARVEILTRRAVLALFPLFCLGTFGPGCSPVGQASTKAGIPRLDKMRERRGTGDPRQKGKRSAQPARRNVTPR